MLGDRPDRAERAAAMVAETPVRRFGEVAEVAALAVMLASDEAVYMAGAELTISGCILAGSAATPGGSGQDRTRAFRRPFPFLCGDTE